MVEYTWDADKEAENVRRRGIDFNEAKSAHLDYWRIEIPDELLRLMPDKRL